ncbi:MAG: electron transfer flavoprotein subunit beta/FixA family protein [Oscillospiraceae bacterium]|nr:electron transfer flavoprotein subunit beta/FixA family protein [Oscillospiraceae bacterium]
MKAFVCVKQVPDTSGKVAVRDDGILDRASMATITNPDDMNAVEAALKVKDATGCKVIVVCMGPNPAAGMLHEILAMGADEAILISGREFGGSDTFATSQIIAAGIQHYGLDDDDIIFCGRQAIDGDTAQVGPQIAEKLHIPQISYAADVAVDGRKVTVKRMLEDGYMMIETKAPCLITCIKELNTPRYMSVKGILEFDQKPYYVYDYNELKDEPLIDPDTIGLKGSPTNVYKSFTPPQKGVGRMLEGSGKETVDELFGILTGKHIL